jgi:hypothetical protein
MRLRTCLIATQLDFHSFRFSSCCYLERIRLPKESMQAVRERKDTSDILEECTLIPFNQLSEACDENSSD